LNTPKISVIIAAFNQERFIGRCLRSLLHQTLSHSDYEIIVVDDGSTDKTPYALELFLDPFDSVVKVITNEENLGLPASLNRAIQKASAPLIVRVDSDDFVNSNFLNFLYVYLESNSEVDAVACDYLLLDDEENVIGRANCFEKPIACGIIFRKSQLIEIGLYDETFLRHEERDLRLRFEKKYRINRLDIPLYRYRRHSNNITNDLEAMNHHEKRLLSKHAST
jgi:glycosyltransferase involved in cell wall biosynthesis